MTNCNQDNPEKAMSVSAIIPRTKVCQSPNCGSMIRLSDGRIMWAWGVGGNRPQPHALQANFSDDGGRNWSDPVPLACEDGTDLVGFLCPSLVRMRSGRLGMVQGQAFENFNQGDARITTTFHTSSDEGRTWSAGVIVNAARPREHPYFDQLHQLASGRLIIPFAGLAGPTPTGDFNHYTLFGEPFRNAYAFNMQMVSTWYSDDEGATWQRSFNEVYASVDDGLGGNFGIGEFGIAECSDSRLLMFGFSGVGRIFRSCSEDGGETWQRAEPTDLQGTGPLCVKRIPDRDDILLIWCHGSRWEAMNGYPRHRLSSAISSDGGVTFKSFRNLESLDDVCVIDPEPLTPYVQRRVWQQPSDIDRYHRAPGPLRVDHPFCMLDGDEAVVAYGLGTLGDADFLERYYHTTIEEVCARYGFEHDTDTGRIRGSNKVWVIPIEALYGDGRY